MASKTVEIEFFISVADAGEIDKLVAQQAAKFFGDRTYYYQLGPGTPIASTLGGTVTHWNFFVKAYSHNVV